MSALAKCNFDKQDKAVRSLILAGLQSENKYARYEALKCIWNGWQHEIHSQVQDKAITRMPGLPHFRLLQQHYIEAWREVMLKN